MSSSISAEFKDFVRYPSISGITNGEAYIYYTEVVLLFWALEGGVVVCCVFFVMTRDIVRHIEFTQRLILENAWDLSTAKRQYTYVSLSTQKKSQIL